MPCITITTDLARGASIPVRVSSVMDNAKEVRCVASLSVTHTQSIICPDLVRRLGAVPLGRADLVLPNMTLELPVHVLNIRVTTGLLGVPPTSHIMRRLCFMECPEPFGFDMKIGLNVLAMGSLTFSATSITFCI